MNTTVERNYQASSLAVTICFGDYGFLDRLKILYFLVMGRTVRFSGNAVRSTSAKDIKEIP
jgi:hypothetical protein